MSVTLSGTVTIENATGSDFVFTITVTAATPQGTTVGTTQVPASAASPGSYKIDDLESGQCFITFQGDNLNDVTEIALLGSSAANVVNVSMEAVVSLSGIITAQSSGDPISGASVTIIDSNNHETSTTTDSSGAYSFESLAVGQYDMEIQAGLCTADPDSFKLNVGSNTRNFSLDTTPPPPVVVEDT